MPCFHGSEHLRWTGGIFSKSQKYDLYVYLFDVDWNAVTAWHIDQHAITSKEISFRTTVIYVAVVKCTKFECTAGFKVASSLWGNTVADWLCQGNSISLVSCIHVYQARIQEFPSGGPTFRKFLTSKKKKKKKKSKRREKKRVLVVLSLFPICRSVV